MVIIFFVTGMFGSTLEFLLRNYTAENDTVQGYITDDGSLHSYQKGYHPSNKSMMEVWHSESVSDILKRVKILTPVYPWSDAKLDWIVDNFPVDLATSKNIFVCAKDFRDAELNMLFQFYKIAKGVLNMGLTIFCGNNSQCIKNWNKKYTHWSEMEPWELREWSSIFYSEWITEWIDPSLTISHLEKSILNNVDVLENLEDAFLSIAKYCNLTVINDDSRFSFIKEWTEKQQYIVEEFNLIDQIVEKTINKENFEWIDARLCFISEAIIQRRLRVRGYEIACYKLNTFPTNSAELYTLLEKT